LFLLQGAGLLDPNKLLKGKGKQARYIVVHDASMLEEAPVEALIIQAYERQSCPLNRRAITGG
jgi:hypothetical protein